MSRDEQRGICSCDRTSDNRGGSLFRLNLGTDDTMGPRCINAQLDAIPLDLRDFDGDVPIDY